VHDGSSGGREAGTVGGWDVGMLLARGARSSGGRELGRMGAREDGSLGGREDGSSGGRELEGRELGRTGAREEGTPRPRWAPRPVQHASTSSAFVLFDERAATTGYGPPCLMWIRS
jgi:hypothetical protein